MTPRPVLIGRDVLRLPLVGRLLRWRWGRLALQLPLLLVAAALVIDGFAGPQDAPRNLATVVPWVHFRGLAVLALLLAGNLFCMACPFTLPRTLARGLSLRRRRFPRRLRGKWLALVSLLGLFLVYEIFSLWASPLLTAWLIVAYFAAAFILEAWFGESAFCKYVCPLGTFNFVYSTLSPTQIAVKDRAVCAACAGKECVRGSYRRLPNARVDVLPDGPREARQGPSGTPGCGLLLFPPQLTTNLDCTFCLDCVRACPHDNIALAARRPGGELLRPRAWRQRWDVTLLVVALAFIGVVSAFSMTPPRYELQSSLSRLGFADEPLQLLAIFGVGGLLLPAGAALLAARLGQALTRTSRRLSLRQTAAAFAPAFAPLGFGIWAAHYSFHFLVAPLTLIPVVQEFLGQPGEWARFGVMGDLTAIGLLQAALLLGGFLWSLWIAQRAAFRLYRRDALPGLLPWALLLLALMLAAGYLFTLPMEMRGTDFLLG